MRSIAPGRAFCSGQAEMGGYFLHQKYQNDVLSAIAAVAEQPARIRRLFPSLEANESGLYMVRLMREGLVREIVVDDFIPVFKEHCTFFVRATAGECWPLILEKGLAKLCGSYQRAMQSSLGDLLRALTFSPVQSVSTALPPDQLWELMREGRRKDYVVCATSGEQSD